MTKNSAGSKVMGAVATTVMVIVLVAGMGVILATPSMTPLTLSGSQMLVPNEDNASALQWQVFGAPTHAAALASGTGNESYTHCYSLAYCTDYLNVTRYTGTSTITALEIFVWARENETLSERFKVGLYVASNPIACQDDTVFALTKAFVNRTSTLAPGDFSPCSIDTALSTTRGAYLRIQCEVATAAHCNDTATYMGVVVDYTYVVQTTTSGFSVIVVAVMLVLVIAVVLLYYGEVHPK
jgi:hypothetical protein